MYIFKLPFIYAAFLQFTSPFVFFHLNSTSRSFSYNSFKLNPLSPSFQDAVVTRVLYTYHSPSVCSYSTLYLPYDSTQYYFLVIWLHSLWVGLCHFCLLARNRLVYNTFICNSSKLEKLFYIIIELSSTWQFCYKNLGGQKLKTGQSDMHFQVLSVYFAKVLLIYQGKAIYIKMVFIRILKL